ncbi:ABC1 kinase family protein [Ornithinicoccus hortensis]|uniref:Putative unusual protein kinase regulating ubiquinone biosynthesis (AarF/ABC1/UbiB family) n=1 Tax=Ornithinicoccus hortensis TaxID=82346 RepID=A0A542YPY9_9MICO|nr:AarF/ABC1/UbiB kinase family protein [Ornithinicoccus hortensis]TQL50172.1 putative unusual protein kinase regulating ubiquinone biosynthesis (AarF/ABC1/UbiB family) [Ornithinicoccus hortensis]
MLGADRREEITVAEDPPPLPLSGAGRALRLARLPLGVAGRAAVGLGRRMGGASGESVTAELRQRTAEEVFAALGELKGGAMKVGQALSVFEAAVPDEMAGPYREALTRLQDQAPPMRHSQLGDVLAESLGEHWRERFREFDEDAAAAASIGQVHRAVWEDGTTVAVKVQYPGAGVALESDLRQLGRISRMIGPLLPGMDLSPVITELQERMVEELDYRREAWSQDAFAEAYADDPDVVVPRVLASGPRVVVSEWLDGVPLNQLIREQDRAGLDRVAERYISFLLGAPSRVGLLHADPHPGNFRLTPDGRLGVVDFGAVDRLPEGLPVPMGRLLAVALREEADTLVDGLRDEGFIRDAVDIDPVELLAFLEPFVAPCRVDRFSFTRDWLRSVTSEINDPRGTAFQVSLRLNLPPQYLLIHRVWLGGTAVLAQMGVDVATRAVVDRYLPGIDLPPLAR